MRAWFGSASCRVGVSALAMLLACTVALGAAAEDDYDEEPPAVDRTPPRLSLVEGEASFWREGAEDWSPARRNTPLAPGDELYTGDDSNLEIQIGARDFLRAGSETRLSLDNDDRDFTQIRLTSGRASLDLHGLRSGRTYEVATPQGAFTIERNGYYRVDVNDDSTRFTARRGGRAVVTPANGETESIAPSEEVVVFGDEVESYAASELDAWDRWNYDRSDRVLEAVSYRHVPDEVYGVDDLDHHGRWRVVPDYGSVWFPSRVSVGWAPYTTGYWMSDPFYGWTWVDDAPWGWAPFHYGRWVHVGGYWGWAPGSIAVRPVYAPALVAFFSSGGVSVGLSFGAPAISWVALGWGEPCHPWWGGRRYVGRPHWLGWGGPRRWTRHTTVVHDIDVYQNVHVHNAVVEVDRDAFARGPVARARRTGRPFENLRPVEGALPVQSDPVRVVGGPDRATRPPAGVRERRVVATRAPQREERSARGLFGRSAAREADPDTQIVPAPKPARDRAAVQRPRFGEQAGDERAAPPAPPRFEAGRGPERPSARTDETRGDTASRGSARAPTPSAAASRRAPERAEPPSEVGPGERPAAAPAGAARREPSRAASRAGAERPSSRREETSRAARSAPAPSTRKEPAKPRDLPGQPANRVYRGRAQAPSAPIVRSQELQPRATTQPQQPVTPKARRRGGDSAGASSDAQPADAPGEATRTQSQGRRGR